MKLEHLAHFDRTARLGSFAAAARAAHVDPSSVSRSVATLEAKLGVSLFVRNTRRLRLTEAGARFHADIVPLLDGLSDAAARVQPGRLSGTVRITASATFAQLVLIDILAVFRAEHPDIRIDLRASDSRLDMIADGIDIALRHGPLTDSALQCRRLRSARYSLYAASDALACHTPEDVAERPHLLFDLPGFRDGWTLVSGTTRTHVPARPALTSDNAASLLRACEAGMGVALLADWTAKGALMAGTIRPALPDWQVDMGSEARGIWMLTPAQPYRSARVAALMDYLVRRIGSEKPYPP